ncbi:amidase signature domain-containing protein [Catenaria anguillulae PL171]|uniref:Glutamyl-tRNA(Gln) amidotransferase subunit A, mitochondrial n=1 Tax=Catenaria anguillulae PL171 TaxID=765915 RepID=A0A1Y2HUJ6_9FUNG|nr:amidase signature domain-containing protein [Catenaria anguillulae PL171]
MPAAGPTSSHTNDLTLTLANIPVAIKANLATASDPATHSHLPTCCASRVLQHYRSPFDATPVAKLKAAGALIVGKTNMDEFGMGSFNINSPLHGPCLQPPPPPRDPSNQAKVRVAGGSSGGSAVAVQTGMVYAALGSDTGGSVRLPASYTGVVGFKPGYGSVSRYGLVPYAHSLDTVGVLTRSVGDARLVYEVIKGHDPLDMTSTATPPSTPTPKHSPLVIGVPDEYNLTCLSTASRQAWSRALSHLESLGHTLTRVSLPSTLPALAAYYVLAPAEASSNLAKFDGIRYGTHRAHFGDEVKRRLMVGAFALSARGVDTYYEQAQRVRGLVVNEFNHVFDPQRERGGVHVLVTPAALGPAPTLDEVARQQPAEAYVNDVFTVPASLAGLPAVVVPGASQQEEARGEYVGVQVIGMRGAEEQVLEVGGMLETMER